MSAARSVLAAALAGGLAAGLIAPAAGAQQSQTEDQGIVTEQLEPLLPGGTRVSPREEGDDREDDRFRPVPFRTEDLPMVPELIAPVETELKAGARLRQLDKMSGQAETVEIAAGEEIRLDRLRIRLEACRAPADNAEHGTMAFLKIWDEAAEGEAAAALFSGWMFAESPALSAMDHPRYDLWVMSCTTASGGASSASR